MNAVDLLMLGYENYKLIQYTHCANESICAHLVKLYHIIVFLQLKGQPQIETYWLLGTDHSKASIGCWSTQSEADASMAACNMPDYMREVTSREENCSYSGDHDDCRSGMSLTYCPTRM